MEIQNKSLRKLELKKKTISKLGQNQMNNYDAGSWTTIYATAACGTLFCQTDITRTIISINPTH